MKVLVNGGGGGSGPLAIQLAKAAGAEVWGVDTAAKADVMARGRAPITLLDFEREDFAARGDAVRPDPRSLGHAADAARCAGC